MKQTVIQIRINQKEVELHYQKSFYFNFTLSHWDWILHNIYSDCATTEPQSVDSFTRWSGDLRRILGLLFAFNI